MKIEVKITNDDGSINEYEIDSSLLSKENLESAANRYAESENSCYTNDYYGYLRGANEVVEIFTKKRNQGFTLDYITEEDEKKELERILSSLKEEDKIDVEFNGESLYYIGSGHDFLYSFFKKYVTKSGICATYYMYGNFWIIDSKEYKYKDDAFTEVIREANKSSETKWDNFQFPIVKNIEARTLSDDIIPVKPKENPEK